MTSQQQALGRAPKDLAPSAAASQRPPRTRQVSGGDIEEVTPDPIPNSEVKLVGADGTARVAVWESRTLPGLFLPVQTGPS